MRDAALHSMRAIPQALQRSRRPWRHNPLGGCASYSRLVLCVIALLAAFLPQAAGGGQYSGIARNSLENSGSLVTQTPFFATLDCNEVLKRLTFDRPFPETVIRFLCGASITSIR
jgi:hypothetical protein